MAPKSKPKSMLSSKGGFLKKPCFSLGKIHFFEIQGVEVETKNRSKIDIKNDAEQKASETRFLSIFDRFGSHLGPPKRSQDAQKSMLKGHQNLIGF